MKIQHLLATLLILAAGSRLSAVEPANFHFKTFQVADGLSENTIYSILQDSKGYLWFGTKDGLNRFDGTRFRVFRQDATKPQSIGENFIRCMAEGENDVFFIGTDAGLYQMSAFEETFTHISRPTADGIFLTAAVNSLYRDPSGIVWIGTIGQGIFTYDPANDELKQILLSDCELGSNAVWQIYGDRSGIIWVATRLGLLRYNKLIDRLEAVDGLFENGSTEHEILSILEDTKGNLWLGTWADGLRHYNKQSFEGVTYLGPKNRPSYVSHIRAIFQYDPKRLLVGSDDGLYMFDTETMDAYRIDIPQSHYSLSDQNIYSIARDKEGGIWIGTYFGGINYLNVSLLPVEFFYPDIHHGMLSGMAVSQFCEDSDGNLWIATEDGGVNYLEVKTRRITQPIQTSYHNTHALLLDGHNLWIGTFSRGIDVYDTRTGKMLNYRMDPTDPQTLNDDCIFSLYKTRNGDIYAGTPVGLNRYDRQTNRFERIPEASGFIYDIKEDEAGNLWIAGTGVIRFDPSKKSWIHYDTLKEKTDPITGSKLTSAYIDNQKRLFFTSDGRGLFVYDYPTDSFRNISEKDGLPNNVTYGVLDDAFGNLWISCNKGIVCFDIHHPADYKLYDQEDGMQSNQFNYKSSHKARDGKFYFGGINGFNSFYPQDLASLKNDHIPPVEITGIQFPGDKGYRVEKEIQTLVNRKQQITLPHDMSSFSISYISLSFRSQNKNQYAYRLEGMDSGWTMAGNNKSVTYLNLPPGKYVFHVKASNNNEVWNETGDSIEIEILPPFWRSLPARLIYILLIVSSFYLLFTYYVRKNKKKQAWQLETFKFEQEKLAVRSKIDFFTNIAHEIRTPVSLIKAPLEEVLLSGDGTDETRQNLSIIDKNCNRLSILINQLLDFRKMDTMNYTLTPESINLNLYISELYERFRKTALSKKIEFSLQLPAEADMFVYSDPDALTKVIGNLLTNAIKFTTSRIAMSLERTTPQSYSITIEDNGVGIPDEQKKLIFDPFYQVGSSQGGTVGTGIGLSLVKSLAHLLEGRIEVSDSHTGGAVFRFTFSSLPADTAEKSETTATGQPQTAASPHTANKSNNVLVVDDNPEISAFISNCLCHEYQVETAPHASEAWKKLEETTFDLIISDIMMPDVDGISFTKRIKADINYSHIPVILLSAKTDNAVKVEGLRSGAEVFMEKPFSTSFLKAQIRTLLANRRTLLDTFNRSPLASYASIATNKSDEAFLNRLNEEIEKHLSDQHFSVESLTDVLHISRSNLQRKLKGICGVTPGDYLRNYRLKKASKLLLETDMRISEVAYHVGFTSASYFTKAFIRCYNMTPKEFLSGKANPDE